MNNKKQQNIQSEKTLTEIFKYNAGGEASEYHIIIHSTKPEDTYYILFTSGSTGKPKGVKITFDCLNTFTVTITRP